MYTYRNPVIPGFNPDPSICRDGDDFYLVTSSFEFFPGVPIYHSRNLVNWECIGHCLTRDEQLPLHGCRPSGGIWAPTLRKHGNIFYMTTTNESVKSAECTGNFIVHTDDIRGRWSNPVWIDQGGIDPSLFFHNNKAYFCSNGNDENTGNRPAVFLCEVDPLSGQKLSPTRLIAYGAGGKFPEAPHIYYINNMFYLILAEGGTEYGHMVTIQRSDTIYGPYQLCPHNPILSHRDRGGHPIQATGHADIVEDKNGNYWMVCLGIRPLTQAMLHNLGRETFLSPLKWVDGWPVVGNNGGIELEMEGPLPAAPEPVNLNSTVDWKANLARPLDTRWNFIRNPVMERYVVKDGVLRLCGDEQALSTPNGNPVFIGMRQQAFLTTAETLLRPPETGKAGISAFYNNNYHYDLFVERGTDNNLAIVLNKRIHDLEAETFRRTILPCNEIGLRIDADMEYYTFSYKCGESAWVVAGKGLVAGLCTEITYTMTFTGVYFGIFASGGAAEFFRFELTSWAGQGD
jgi:alpha-N-arabinofuranosidase